MKLFRQIKFLFHYRLSLNRRATVEQELWNVYNKKSPLPDREKCREWARKLGNCGPIKK